MMSYATKHLSRSKSGWRSRTDFEQGLRNADAMTLQDLLNIRLGVSQCSTARRHRELRDALESTDEVPLMDHAYGDWNRNAGGIANGLTMEYYPWDVVISLMHGFHSGNDELADTLTGSLRRTPASFAYLVYSLARLLGDAPERVARYSSSDLSGMVERLDLTDRLLQFFYLYHAFRIGQAKYAAREVWKDNDIKLGCITQAATHLFNDPGAATDSLSRFEAMLAYLNFQVKGMASMDEVKPYMDAIGRFFDAHELDAGGIAAIQHGAGA
jgi:hypothetical protein